jgi:diguanylate cyclase (GGDEF)-like protein
MFDTLPRIHGFIVKRNKPTALYLALLLVALVGYLDYITGFEVSLSFLYLIPIAVATWYVNSKAGYVVTFVSVVTFLLSNWAAGETYSREIIRFWNGFTRLMIFVMVIWLLQEFKRALAHERMLSQTDYLTGIANNRELYQQVQAELRRASRSKRPISLVYIDLDGFKQVNDRLGHRSGDALLRTVAAIFQSMIRRTDTAARLGGDEFAILLPNTGQAGARCIMQRLQAAFLKRMEASQTNVTLSAGVISFASPPASVDEMIHQADALMYKAKAGGKNDIMYGEG